MESTKIGTGKTPGEAGRARSGRQTLKILEPGLQALIGSKISLVTQMVKKLPAMRRPGFDSWV